MSLDEFAPKPKDDQLKELADLATELHDLRCQIANVSSILQSLQEDERELSQVTLPEKMKEIGMSTFSLKSGEKVSIKHKIKASLTKARKEEGFAWLRENGHGTLIKERVVEENVHPQTLSAFAREQLAQGKPLPECFSVYEYDQTEIK